MRVLYEMDSDLWELLGGLGVLLGAMSDHRVTHPPIVVCCIQGEWFTFPCDTAWWHMHRLSGSPSPMAYEQDECFTFSCWHIIPMQSGTHGKYLSSGQ